MKKAQEAITLAAEESASCKSAKEVIKSLTAQVNSGLFLCLLLYLCLSEIITPEIFISWESVHVLLPEVLCSQSHRIKTKLSRVVIPVIK